MNETVTEATDAPTAAVVAAAVAEAKRADGEGTDRCVGRDGTAAKSNLPLNANVYTNIRNK